jgi:type VI secretion system protein ImpA
MTQIDLGSLLNPISADAPCGANLEYDPAFGELERSAQRTPERVMGDKVIPAEEPNWSDVLDKSLALFAETKDLRVAAHLVHAGLRTGGLPELAAGIALIRKLLNDYWDSVHPQLDKDDNDDPTLRMNSLSSLNDRAGLVGSLSRCPLIQSRTIGRVSLRDIRIAAGEVMPTPEESAASLDAALIDAAFLDGDADELKANAEAVQTALEDLKALNAHVSEQVGASYAPELGALTAELQALRKALSEQLARRGLGDGAADADAPGGAGQPAAAQAVAVGEIRSREDVVRVLDRVCDYFQKNEPSSPVPLLLKRAKRLVSKDFMDILRDLTPDGVSQAELIGGLNKED